MISCRACGRAANFKGLCLDCYMTFFRRGTVHQHLSGAWSHLRLAWDLFWQIGVYEPGNGEFSAPASTHPLSTEEPKL